MFYPLVLFLLLLPSLFTSERCFEASNMSSWKRGYKGLLKVQAEEMTSDWTIGICFTDGVNNLETWKGNVAEDGNCFNITNKCYNGILYPCQCLNFDYIVRHGYKVPVNVTQVSFNGVTLPPCLVPLQCEMEFTTTPPPPPEVNTSILSTITDKTITTQLATTTSPILIETTTAEKVTTEVPITTTEVPITTEAPESTSTVTKEKGKVPIDVTLLYLSTEEITQLETTTLTIRIEKTTTEVTTTEAKSTTKEKGEPIDVTLLPLKITAIITTVTEEKGEPIDVALLPLKTTAIITPVTEEKGEPIDVTLLPLKPTGVITTQQSD